MSEAPDNGRRSLLRRLVQPVDGNPDVFSTERSFAPSLGQRVGEPGRPRGYYIDFSNKARSPTWPPEWLASEDVQLHISSVQWALGAFERYLAGDGRAWLRGAIEAGEFLIGAQISEGPREGALLHWMPMPHTYRIDPPWSSSITQGEAASLFVRLYGETGEQRFADAARRSLIPMRTPTCEGGLLTEVDGGLPFFEEYPTQPPSLVLNGAIFALWGFRDVATVFGDEDAARWYERGLDALAATIGRYDTGSWSRYDLYPHPVANVASPAYHLLHITQLSALERISPRPELSAARRRFEAYRESSRDRRLATLRKVGFRLVTPRSSLLAHRLPWNTWVRRHHGGEDLVVLCYHAISEDWSSRLAVTPGQLRDQVKVLLDAGFRPTTFSQGVLGSRLEKSFAVTFDDSYRSVGELAKPVLDELGVPGTVFVPTAFAGAAEPMSWPGISEEEAGPGRRELMAMSWEGLRELAESGWEVGSHTHSHPRLTEAADEDAISELTRSRAECELNLGRACLSVAYPYGDYDHRVVVLAARAGYAAAAALPPPFGDESVLAWPRIGVYRVDDKWRLRLKISKLMRLLRRSRAGPLITRISLGTSREPGKAS